jgi:hypothetical protein
MANPNKFTAKEVLNKVLLDSSGNAVTANSVTSQEALNSVLDTTNNRLNMSLAGGTISGDVTISGDLTVSGSNTYTYDEQIDGQLWLKDSTASSATQGGHLRLFSDDGAAMAAGHRLGVIEFAGAEDASSTITVGARIEALAESTYTSSENGSALLFYTTDGNASQSEVMRITSDSKIGIGNASDGNVDTPLHLRVEGGGNNVLTNGIKIEDPAISGTEHLGILFSGRTDNPGGKAYMGAVRADNYGVMDLVFYTDSAADDGSVTTSDNVMTFTHDGDLAIGSSTASRKLQITDTSANTGIRITTGTALDAIIDFGDTDDGDIGQIRYDNNTDQMHFKTSTTDKFIIDTNSRISLSNNDTGTSNTIFGKNAGDSDGAGDYNVFVGELAGGSGTQTDDADNNVGLGYNALNALTTGDSNTAVGAYALTDNLTGEYNIAIGVEALKNPQAPSKNIMIGYQAGLATTLNVPSQNIGVGYQALKSLSNGNYNVAMGTNAGDVITTGDNCVVIGHGADPSGADAQNQTVIGSSAIGAGDNSVVLGDSNVTSVLCASDGEAQLYASAIRFPATQVANGNANALDDYEEGTFTPAYTLSSVGDASWTHDRQIGRYTKVGNVVHFQCFVRTDAYSNSSGSGDLRISGLPFTSDSTTNVVTAVSVSASGFASNNNPISARIVNGVNYISLYKRTDANDGDTSLDQNSTLNGSNENSILIGGSYRTA